MISTRLGKLSLSSCIYNASGPRTGSIEALMKIGESSSGAVLTKSSTLVEQSGNNFPRFINKISLGRTYCNGSINSEGLPNLGIDYYISDEAFEKIHTTGKPYIVSLSGLSLQDNLEMLKRIYSKGPNKVSAIELNLACPNIPNKPIIAYDFEQLDQTLKAVTALEGFASIPLGIKLAPYFDNPHFEVVAGIIAKYPIAFIVCTNTIGNVLYIDAENECEGMAARSGFGGLGGGFIKHVALANVRLFYNLFNGKYNRPDIDIVGVGGISTGIDVFEFILAGAKAVQVGTCHWTEGASCFGRIAQELQEIMTRKGYHSLAEFRGKVKPYIKPQAASRESHTAQPDSIQSSPQNYSNSITVGVLILIIIFLLVKDYYQSTSNSEL